jgi:hypothetical protein
MAEREAASSRSSAFRELADTDPRIARAEPGFPYHLLGIVGQPSAKAYPTKSLPIHEDERFEWRN